MESDDLDGELEGQNETNEDMLIGFADEGDDVVLLQPFEASSDSDVSSFFRHPDSDSDFVFDSPSDSDDDGQDDEDTMKNSSIQENDESGDASKGNAATGMASTSTATTATVAADDDDEDDIIAKILANSKAARTHPPDINIDDYVVDLSFHPDADILAAGTISGDALIYKYSVDENVLVNTLELHLKAIRDIEFNYDGSVLFSASKDRSILLTDVETGKFRRCYEQAHEQPVSKMNVFDEHLFATGDDDGTVKVWDVREKASSPIFSLKEVDDYITSIMTNDARKVLVTTSGDGYLTAINIGARYDAYYYYSIFFSLKTINFHMNTLLISIWFAGSFTFNRNHTTRNWHAWAYLETIPSLWLALQRVDCTHSIGTSSGFTIPCIQAQKRQCHTCCQLQIVWPL